jgi:hypothetical protein
MSNACDPRTGFAKRVETALRDSLALLAASPALARLLTVEVRIGDEEVTRRQRYWHKRFGALLRHAARADPEIPTHPHFLEVTLIGAISWLIASRVLSDRTGELEQLLPSASELILACYLGPEEAARITRAPQKRLR